MKQHLFTFLSILVTSVVMAPAASFAAAEEYFVEVGDDVKKEDATKEWDALVAGNKSLLSKLKLYPKDVLQDGQAVTTRMQAGPISSKTQALKICNKLFAKDISCFVIEGVNDMPPTAMMHLNSRGTMASNGSLPGLTASSSVGAAPEIKGEDTAVDGSVRLAAKEEAPEPVKGTVVLPWLEAKPVEKPASYDELASGEAPVKKAEVQVAEAIRVPLTQTVDLEDKIRVSALPELKPSFGIRQLRDESNEMGTVNSGAGWLDIGSFVNEEIASSLWEEVLSANRKQAKNLNMRVSHAAVASENDKITLSVGPFANSAEAFNFCRSGLQANDRGLRCSFVANDKGIAGGKVLALNARADAYEARRRPQENPYTSTSSATRAAQLSPASGPSKQYWVQVVSADSQIQALKEWEQLKSANAEVIGNLRSSVSASSTDKSSYVVRVGPISENDQAIHVCSELQKRNVECRVLLYSMGNS